MSIVSMKKRCQQLSMKSIVKYEQMMSMSIDKYNEKMPIVNTCSQYKEEMPVLKYLKKRCQTLSIKKNCQQLCMKKTVNNISVKKKLPVVDYNIVVKYEEKMSIVKYAGKSRQLCIKMVVCIS